MNIKKDQYLQIYHMFWKKYKWDDLAEGNIVEKDQIGIYQIYGNHAVYGKNCLLYIGKTVEQGFQNRLDPKQHWDFIINHYSEFSHIHIGTLKKWDDLKEGGDEKAIITKIEKLLINAHTPAFNSMEIKGLYPYEEDNQFILLNWLEHGDLLPEVSTLRYSEKCWNSVNYP